MEESLKGAEAWVSAGIFASDLGGHDPTRLQKHSHLHQAVHLLQGRGQFFPNRLGREPPGLHGGAGSL